MKQPGPLHVKALDLFHGALERLRLSESTSIVVIATVIGVLGGFGAIGFRLLIQGCQLVAVQQTGDHLLARLAELHWLHLLLLPTIGLAVVSALVYLLAREAKGHGVPEVMEAVALHGGRIRPRVMAVKSVASALCIATGGSVGREGPIVQIGSALGSSVGQLLHLPQQQVRLLVGCGAAAGIAATFNAPVAGVMFAIEVILGSYAITTLTPLILSSVLATVVCHAFPAITGGDVRAFAIPFEYTLVSAWEIPAFFVLGALAAFLALAFIWVLYRFEDVLDAAPVHPIPKAALGGLALGALFLWMPGVVGHAHCFGIGYETIELALRGELALSVLALLVGLKLLATSLTLGAGGSGGIFAPSLFLGAMLGGAFGLALEQLFPGAALHSGAYALVGMGAMVAGTTHAPITAILILFELTGSYKIMLPLMIACVMASLVTSRLKRDSIYTQKLSRRGVNLHLGLEATIMSATRVGDLMRRDVPTIDVKAPFHEVLQRVLDEEVQELYAVDDAGRLRGVVTLNNVKGVINEAGLDQVLIAADLTDTHTPVVTPDTVMLECMKKLGTCDTAELPVVDDLESRRLVGIVTRRSIFQLYNREVLRQGTLGLKYISRAERSERSDFVEIAEGHQVTVVPVKGAMVGRTLRELDLRARFRVHVVSIKAHRYDHRHVDADVPDPGHVLRPTDRLVVVGAAEAIARLKRELHVGSS